MCALSYPTHLIQRIITTMSSTQTINQCSAITCKGTQCKNNAVSNGVCKRHQSKQCFPVEFQPAPSGKAVFRLAITSNFPSAESFWSDPNNKSPCGKYSNWLVTLKGFYDGKQEWKVEVAVKTFFNQQGGGNVDLTEVRIMSKGGFDRDDMEWMEREMERQFLSGMFNNTIAKYFCLDLYEQIRRLLKSRN
jgi:hypothetical protein